MNEESIIYCPGKRNTTRKGSNEPKKSEVPYYINKNSEVLDKIQHDLANHFTGKIWYYERIYNSEQIELNKKRSIDMIQNNKDETTVSDKHSEATHFLQAYIHLYLWCNKFIKEINNLSYEPNVRIPFCLLDTARPLPPCHCCQESYRQIRFEKRYRDLTRILINSNRYLAKIRAKQHGVHNADELQLTDGL